MTETTIIRGGTVLTLNDAEEVHFGGTVVIEDERIVRVAGPGEAARWRAPGRSTPPQDRDAGSGRPPLPHGFGQGLERPPAALGVPADLLVPMIRALDPEAAYWAALASYAESIRGGVTTVNDMYRAAGGARRRGRGDRHPRRALQRRRHRRARPRQPRRQCRRLPRQARRRRRRIQVRVGIEWLPLASRELLRGSARTGRELGTGIHIHLNESLSEVEIAKKMFGRRPTEVAYEEGILGPDCIAAHCVWLSDTEIALMRETGTQISHNPPRTPSSARGGAAAGDARRRPQHRARPRRGRVQQRRDMFEVMKWASLLHRAVRVDASLQQASDVVADGDPQRRRRARSRDRRAGCRPQGRLILVETNSTMFTPLMPESVDHVYSHLVFAANGSVRRHDDLRRQVLMEGGVLTVDEDEVIVKANAAFAKWSARMVVPDLESVAV